MAISELVCHRDTPTASGSISVSAEAGWKSSNQLAVTFLVNGDVSIIRFPEQAVLARRDGLWNHSCFELFAGLKDGGYLEFNLSPSGEWAAYRFKGYRDGMAELDIPAPTIAAINLDDPKFTLIASLNLGSVRASMTGRLAISAVIEEREGTKSYWALRHPPGQADFHHPNCFALHLPAVGQA